MVMFSHALNRRLQQDTQLANITIVVMSLDSVADPRTVA